MLKTQFQKRFNELKYGFANIRRKQDVARGDYFETGDWKRWATSAENLIKAACGVETPHFSNFREAFKECKGYDHEVLVLLGVFMAAKEDFEGGYLFNVDLRVSGEVFGDFVVLAKQALSQGHKDVAAVLACAALEDALKRYAAANDLSVDGKTMIEVVNALKGSGLVSGAQKTLLDAMPRIRNHALHAEWDKLSEPDVNSVIGFVEQFLLTNFD